MREVWISNLAVAADTLKHSGASNGGGERSDWMIHHISDSRTFDLEPFGHITLPQFPPIHIGGITIDLSITNHVFLSQQSELE